MKLFIPGPVDVRQEVLDQLSKPIISHRSQGISTLQTSIEKNLKLLMNTQNSIVVSSSSGTGAMEMALRSLTLKKALILSNGAFGDRFYEIALHNQIPADLLRFDDGKPIDIPTFEAKLQENAYDTITITHNETSTSVMNNLEALSQVYKSHPELLVILDTVSSLGGVTLNIDAYDIDVCVSASQKAIGLPPGLSFVSLSPKAIQRLQKIGHRGYYLDLKRVYDLHVSKQQYPSTPTISLMYALDYQLNYMIHVEGLQNRFNRHLELAHYTRTWAKKYFKLLALDGYQSHTVTAIIKPDHLDNDYLKSELKKRGYVFSDGYGQLKGTSFRVAHMADRSLEELKDYLKAIETIWQLS